MARPGLYNDNLNRAFPFLKGAVGGRSASASTIEGLVNDAIVDAGFVAGLHSGFVDAEHRVWLQSVTRDGSTFTFRFESDAPGLYGRPLVFTRTTADPDYATEHADDVGRAADAESESVSASLSAHAECDPEPLWSGYLVTGSMAALAAAIPGDGTIARATDDGGIVEPALVQNMNASYVGTLNLANDDRTRVDAPSDCPPIDFGFPTGLVYVNTRCLVGQVRFRPGFNVTVRQDTGDNAIVLGASPGAGLGQPCDEVELFAGETPPDGSTLLEGGPRCSEVVRSINGIGGQFSTLLNGLGVQITPVPDEHTILIDVNMEQLAICYSESPFSDVSETP